MLGSLRECEEKKIEIKIIKKQKMKKIKFKFKFNKLFLYVSSNLFHLFHFISIKIK